MKILLIWTVITLVLLVSVPQAGIISLIAELGVITIYELFVWLSNKGKGGQ